MTEPTHSRNLMLGQRSVTVAPFSGRKAIRAVHLLKDVSEGAPEIFAELAKFVRDYEKTNSLHLTRAQALFQFPPGVDPDTGDRIPGRFEHLTDADWTSCANVVTLPRSPTVPEQVAAVLPKALELAEKEVLRLLALVAMSNEDVKVHDKAGQLEAQLDELADEIIDAPYEELIELAVLGGEGADEQYRRKAAVLGDRLGNAMRLVGIKPRTKAPEPEPPEPSGSSTPTPPSSTPSDGPTAGPPTSPSTPTTASSPDSATA